MPDPLISFFLENDSKKKNNIPSDSPAAGVEKTTKNGHKIKVPLEAYTVEVGIAQKNPIDGVSIKDPRFLGGNLLICSLVKSVNVSISINLQN